MTRLLICGDREWGDYHAVFHALKARPDVVCVIEGECRGADTIARCAAENLRIPVDPYPADWDTHGLSAGHLRNQQMLDEGAPSEVWAFHDDINSSKGTRDMVRRATFAEIQTWVLGHGISGYWMQRWYPKPQVTRVWRPWPEGPSTSPNPPARV